VLNNDLVITSNGAGNKPGATGAITFALVAALINDKSLRREAATALTTPTELSVQHSISGSGFKARCRSVVRMDYRDLTQDTTLTAGVIPSASAYLVIDRPLQSAGKITDAILKRLIGSVLDVIMATGQLDKLLNQEG